MIFFFWTLHKILSIPLLFIQHLPDRNFLPFILPRLLIPLFIFILETFASLMKSTFRNVVSAFHNAITAIIVCRLWLMCLASSNFIGSDRLVLCSAVKMTVLLGYCLPCRWSSALSTLKEALAAELPGAGGFGFRELVREIQGPSEVKPKTLL